MIRAASGIAARDDTDSRAYTYWRIVVIENVVNIRVASVLEVKLDVGVERCIAQTLLRVRQDFCQCHRQEWTIDEQR